MKCIICDHTSFKIKYPDQMGLDGKKYDIYECETCKYVTIFPIPSEAELCEFYSISYENTVKNNIYEYKNAEDFISTTKSVVEDTHVRLREIEKFTTPAHQKLLDVGCGYGLSVLASQERGYIASGIDLDQARIALGKKYLDVTIQHLTLNQCDETYDIITEWQVLEHVLNPDTHVEDIYNKLNTNGLFSGSCPNINGIYAEFKKQHWNMIIPPEHINYFNESTLAKLLTKKGFHVLFIGTIPMYSTPNICFGIRSKVHQLIAHTKSVFLKKNLLVLYRLLTLLKRHCFFKPLNFIIMKLHLGGNSLFWIAQKRDNHSESTENII